MMGQGMTFIHDKTSY